MLIFYVILFNFRLNEREANQDKPRNDVGMQNQDIRYEPITSVPELKPQFCLLLRGSLFSRASRSTVLRVGGFVLLWKRVTSNYLFLDAVSVSSKKK